MSAASAWYAVWICEKVFAFSQISSHGACRKSVAGTATGGRVRSATGHAAQCVRTGR